MIKLKKLCPLTIASLLSLLVSCSSSDKVEETPPPPPKEEGRKFHKSFVLMNASLPEVPGWIEEPQTVDSGDAQKKNRYFVAEGTHRSRRLCLRSAQARSAAKVATEIAQFIKNTYAEATQGGDDEEVTSYIQDNLAQETQSFVVGAQVMKTYWEKRSYKVSLGAEEDKIEYSCYALVRMEKKHLEKAIQDSRNKLLKSISNPEVKQKTEKILSDISDKFDQQN